MTYAQIVALLAPCGLNCSKCMGYQQGEIQHHAQELRQLLGAFDVYAQRFSRFLPVFENYPAFQELLNFFCAADCQGCRKGACKYPHCGVITCFREKGIDFCFQCAEFPCEKTNFDEHLKKRWLKMNLRLRAIGVEAYYEETKDAPRYSEEE